jgi:TonB-dependent Receptor Plug Domain
MLCVPCPSLNPSFANMSCRLLRAAGALALLLASASPLCALQQDSTDARTVIVVDSLDRAAFANVAELLQARVPGLHIARTGDGGMRWFMRGPSSVAESTPMVLVDDVRINTAGSAMPEMGTRPPLLDEIDIEDVERIEVWSGPATAVQHGTGAGNGVIRIVTFAPRAQRTSLRVATWAGTLDENVTYPANANRSGLDTAGRFFHRCTLQMEANEFCTQTGPLTLLNVLESESPFETGNAARVSASLASGTEQLAWRGSATFDRQGSTAGTLANQRFHLRGAGTVRATQDANVTLRANWMRGDADLPSLGHPSLLRQGLLAPADTVWPGFVEPPVSPYNSERYGVALDARWHARRWLDTRLTSGVERMKDENDLEYSIQFGTLEPRHVDERGERRRRDLTIRLDGEARYGGGSSPHATALTVEHVVSKQEEEFEGFIEINGNPIAGRAFWINNRTQVSGIGLTQRLRFPGRVSLLGALRADQVRMSDVRWDVPLSPHVSASWDVRPFTPGAGGGVRLRAALGDVANVPQTTRIFFFLLPGEPERPKAEVTRERELGVDAAIAHDRVGLSFTWYTKRTSNVGNVVPPPFPGFQRIEVLNRGIETTLRGRILQTARFTWDMRAWYAYNHNEVTRGSFTALDVGHGSSSQRVVVGHPLGAHYVFPIVSVRDLDGDGLIDDACFGEAAPCEAVTSSSLELHPAYPPTSASLETSFRFGALTLRAMLDYRSGDVMDNRTTAERCFSECQALYDPSTSLRDQAEAILAPGSTRTVVQDASYTKLREISLRIQTPASWARALGGSRLSVSLAGRNVATWTDYSGLDPETTSLPWIPLANEDDAAAPLPRRFLLRIDLQ